MFIFMTFSRSSWPLTVHRQRPCIPLELLCKNTPSYHQSYSGPTRVASAWNGQHCWPILYVLLAGIPPYTSRRSWRARWRLSSWRSTLIPSMVCVERGEVTYIDGLVQDCSISIAQWRYCSLALNHRFGAWCFIGHFEIKKHPPKFLATLNCIFFKDFLHFNFHWCLIHWCLFLHKGRISNKSTLVQLSTCIGDAPDYGLHVYVDRPRCFKKFNKSVQSNIVVARSLLWWTQHRVILERVMIRLYVQGDGWTYQDQNLL